MYWEKLRRKSLELRVTPIAYSSERVVSYCVRGKMVRNGSMKKRAPKSLLPTLREWVSRDARQFDIGLIDDKLNAPTPKNEIGVGPQMSHASTYDSFQSAREN